MSEKNITLEITVDKDDLINLICGTTPSYELMNDEKIKKCGHYNGSYGNWNWYRSLLSVHNTEVELYELYLKLKNKK